MAALTLADVFGANAAISNGVLSITLADFSALNAASPTASQVFGAILLNLKTNQPATAQEDTAVGVYIGDPFLTISRGDTQLERQYPVSLYSAMNITDLDPDDVI